MFISGKLAAMGVLALLTTFASGVLYAQTGEPPELLRLRGIYEREQAKLTSAYRDQLEKLGQALLRKGDADGARPVYLELGKYPAPKESNLEEGLVLYYDFSKPEKPGEIADLSPCGNHGKVTGTECIEEGAVGTAYTFDRRRLSDGILVKDSESLHMSRITISVWIKTEQIDAFWNMLLNKGNEDGFLLCLGGDGGKNKKRQWRGRISWEMEKNKFMKSATVVADGEWHHVVAYYDGQEQRLYLDGKGGDFPHEWAGEMTPNRRDLDIGNSANRKGTAAYDGMMDELRIYNRALTEQEIALLGRRGPPQQ